MNISQFLDMGGYGMYVWPAYCITLLVFVSNTIATLRERNRIKKMVKQKLFFAKKEKSEFLS